MAKQQVVAEGQNSIGELVRRTEQNFIYGMNYVSKYVQESPYEDINKIEAYLNSKHTSGEHDALQRKKPFFNIVLAARNIWFRATDLDRKDATITASNSKQVLPAFIATVLLQNWMKKDNFGVFLNQWGLNLASYNSSVVKFVEKDGELHRMVIPWNRFICDFIDFDSNPKIEILELTPAQLKQRKGYDQEMVKNLMDALSAREQTNRQKKDSKNDYIKLYEIHGNLPLSYLTGNEEDEEEFVQQMHVISFVESKGKGNYDDFTLYSGRESQDPYMLTALMPSVDGSVSLQGSVKTLFDSQWMVNHSVKLIKDQLDLSSKVFFQTSDPAFTSQNALLNIENGDILSHQPNQPLTQVQNNSHDIASLQNYGLQWKALAQEITSTPDIMQGKNMPSGTAFRQAAIIQQESHDNFEVMTENKGLALEEMLRRFIIPHLKKKLNNRDEIVATLEDNDVKRIEAKYVKNEAIRRTNNDVVEMAIKGEGVTPEMQQMMLAKHSSDVQESLNAGGDKRFFVPSEITSKQWKDMFKDFEWEVDVNITGENKNKQVVLETLLSVLDKVAGNPAMLQDPNAKMLFNKILSQTGVVSPIEIQEVQAQPQPQQLPAQMVGGMGNERPS